ncbi:MAG TPA: peptidyl-prolyl cis-trans isomerase [Blastocatellia bacterium]|nr:peptidyl-prolyl cis-trans isomerase [Blastocatellia bacterium]
MAIMKLITAGVAVLLVMMVPAASRAQEPELVSEIVAQVNNDIITKADYMQALRDFKDELSRQMAGKSQAEVDAEFAKLKPTVLNLMIEDLLLEQKAKELNIDVEADVNQQMAAIAREQGAKDVLEFEAELKKQGIDPEGARASLRKRIQHDAVIQSEVLRPIYQNIPEQEKRKFYESHKDAFVVPGEVVLSEIFLPLEGQTATDVEQRAKRLAAELRAGGDFAESVQKISPPSRASRAQNGKLGSFKLEDLKPEVKAAISSLKQGEVTDPIRLQDGYQIVRVDDRKPETIRKYEDQEVAGAIGRALTMERAQEAQKKYVDRLRQEAYIFIKPEYNQDLPKAEKEGKQVSSN